MSESTEKAKELAIKGKEKARELYDKGNELMDKVSFLKNPLYKKIAWGVAGVVCVLLAALFFRGITSSSNTPFSVAKKCLVACVSGDAITCLSLSGDDKFFSSEEYRLAQSILIKKLQEQKDEASSKLSDEEFKLVSLHMKKEFFRDEGFVMSLIKNQLDSNTDSWAFESWSDDVWTMLEQAFGEMREIETKIDGDKATVMVSVSLKGKDVRIKVHLLKIEGEWKVNTEATKSEALLHE